MASEVGAAYVSIVPSARNFAKQLDRQVGPGIQKFGATAGAGVTRGIDGKLRDAQGRFVTDGGKSGKALGKKFAGGFGVGLRGLGLGGAASALGLGLFVKKASQTEAAFSQIMNTLAATTNTPKAGIRSLSDLALKFGQDTVFSANEAAQAMLELAKGGLSVAQIKGGALSETLTLAAASGTDLATASTILSNAMNTFGLAAADAPKITAALAGGANASTASIQSLGEALQQVGPGAVNAGLSVQETVAALAAFDNAGIKGSDAGTSLKTMLARLVPMTDKATNKMDELGLTFLDSQGNILPLVDIAGRLKEAFRGLSDEEKTSALNRIFGSDASRAASVLATEGVKGIQGFLKATNDISAAQAVAKARMQGTAGAVEQLKGSFETAQLRIGQALAPAIQAGAGFLTRVLNGLATQIPVLVQKMRDPFGTFQTEVMPRLRAFGTFITQRLGPALLDFFQRIGPTVGETLKSIGGSIKIVLGAFSGGETGATDFGTAIVSVLRAAAPVAIVLLKAIALAIRGISLALRTQILVFRMLATIAIPIIRAIASKLLAAFGLIVTGAAKAFGWVPGIGPKLKSAAAKFAIFKAQVNAALSGFGKLGFDIGSDFAANLAAGIAGRGQVTRAAATGTANKLAAGLKSGGLIEGMRANSVSTGGGSDLNVTVNNPLPERTSDSVDKVLRRKRHAAGWSAG